jgi:cytochrome c553
MDTTARRWIFDLTAWTIGLLAGTALIAHEAMADAKRAAPPNERWSAECGTCHVAYPPRLLPAPTWHRIMSQLDRHFGVDASADPAAAAEIGAYLERYSGPERRTALSSDTQRITESRWFLHEHAEVPAAVWKLPAVKSAANCAACHTRAEQGDFRERNIRIPH